MKYFLILLTVVLYGKTSAAQTAEDSVKAVINTMFTAMKNADANTLQTCFADSIVFQTIGRDKEGKLSVLKEDPAGFLDIIRKQTPGAADERI